MRSNKVQTDKTIYRPCILSRNCSLDIPHFKFCDRVITQSTDVSDDILVSLAPDKYGLGNDYYSLDKAEQT